MKYSPDQELQYKAAVTQILKKVMQLGSPTRIINKDDLADPLVVWIETLMHVVPLDKLSATWRRTLAKHDSEYPINAFEILKNFHELEAEIKTKQDELLAKEMDANPVRFCRYYARHGDDAMMLDNIGGIDGIDIYLPCPTCRPDAYRVRYAEEKKKHIARGGKDPITIKQFVRKMALEAEDLKPKTRFDSMSSMEIIASLQKRVGLEAANMVSEQERLELQQAYRTLTNAAKYMYDRDASDVEKAIRIADECF